MLNGGATARVVDHGSLPRMGGGPGTTRGVLFEAAVLGVLALGLNLVGNGQVSLWDRDEPRYAGCTREMRASGDWIHPTFNGEPRYHKPILIYWLMLGGTALGGDNPFGARLVSAIAGVGTVLLTWAWGRRVLGARAGRYAAMVLATAPLMVVESKLATTDATLTLLVTGCQLAIWKLCQSPNPAPATAAAFWILLALAVLTKSPAGPALLAASAAASWWWGGPIPSPRRLAWKWGLPLALAIALPWNIAILLRSQGEYFKVAIGYHVIQRATESLEQHGGFPGYYAVVGLALFFPWSAFLPLAVAAAWTKRRKTPAAGFLLGWLLGPLVFLECVRTKLIHYFLPALPAAALLVGWMIARLVEDPGCWSLREGLAGRLAPRVIRAGGWGLAVGLLVASGFLPGPLRLPLWLLTGLFVLLARSPTRDFASNRIERGVFRVAGLMAAILATTYAWLLPAAEPYRISSVVGRKLAAHEKARAAPPVLCTFQSSGVVYSLGHPAPLVRSAAALEETVKAHGQVLAPLLPEELDLIRSQTELNIEIEETVQGFNIEKGRTETVHLSLIRPRISQIAKFPRTPNFHR